MSRKLMIMCLLLLTLGLMAGAVHAVDYCVNPGFEDGEGATAPPWSFWGGTGGAVANPFIDANNPSPRVWSNFGNPTYVNAAAQNNMSTVYLEPGATYHVHAQYYVPASELAPGVTARAGIYLSTVNAGTIRILDPRYPEANVPPVPSPNVTPNQWFTFDFDWVCPGTPGTPIQLNYMSFRMFGGNGTEIATVNAPNPGCYFDNCQFSLGAALPTYTITSSAGANGTITPAGAVTVSQHANQTFTFSAAPGYAPDMVTIDGGTPVAAGSSYTFTDVQTDHTIAVTFKSVPIYTITASAGANGTITPAGAVGVTQGLNQTFNFTPDAGYVADKVTIDGGAPVTAGTSYTFSNVQANHSIAVTFKADPDYDVDLFFSAKSSNYTGTGNWPITYPAGTSMTPIGTPTTEMIGGQPWVKIVADGPGFRQGTYTDAIPVNGATAVAVIKMPDVRTPSNNWDSVIDVFYDRLVLGVRNDTGLVNVRLNGSLEFAAAGKELLPGAKVILSLVVQSGGAYEVFANGQSIMVGSTAAGMTALTPGAAGHEKYVNVGRNDPDGWTTFNGNIGDVYLYKTALDTSVGGKLKTLENALAAKFGISTAVYTINASAGAGGTISPNGAVLVPGLTDKTFTITPNVGFAIADVLVDGSSVGAVPSYTFPSVSANHTISASFVGLPMVAASGKVVKDGTTVGIPNATVYFSTAPNASMNATWTTITDASGNYNQMVPPGVWYVCASATGYTVSADINPTINTATTLPDIALVASGRNIPAMDKLIFSALTEALPESGVTGPWAADMPKGLVLNNIDAPSVEVIEGVKWEKNQKLMAMIWDPTANGGAGGDVPHDATWQFDGYRVGGERTTAIPVDGASIVAVVKPVRDGHSTGWTSVVDVFYNKLCMGVHNDTGEIVVWRDGQLINTGAIIPDGQKTVLAMVVQPTGEYKVYANGYVVYTNSGAANMTALVPGDAGFQHYINVGRNDPDGWTVFNGNIGDVFLYKVALSKAELSQLQVDLGTKFGIELAPPPTSLSGIVKTAGGAPIYNAVVQIQGYQGPAVVTGVDGSFAFPEITVAAGTSFEIYADAFGYNAYIGAVTAAGGGTQDIVLTPAAETTMVNGNFEQAMGAEWVYGVDDAPGNDMNGTPFPVANADMYTYGIDATENTTPGGSAAGFFKRNVAHPTPGKVKETQLYPVPNPDPGLYASSTGVTSTVLTDSSAAWTVDQFAGQTLVLKKPLGTVTKNYQILTNDATTITIASGDIVADGFSGSPKYMVKLLVLKYWYTSWIDHTIAAEASSKYNFYFKMRATGTAGRMWVAQALAPGTDGTLGEVMGFVDPVGGWYWNSLPETWAQKLEGLNYGWNKTVPMLRLPVPAETTAVNLGFIFWDGDDANQNLGEAAIYFDDMVIDKLTADTVKGTISQVKGLPNGTPVELEAKVVTLAPKMSGTRNTDYFYIEESDRLAGIKVNCDPANRDSLSENDIVTVTGTIATDPSGEKFVQITGAAPTGTAGGNVAAFGVVAKTVADDAKAGGELVRVAGTVVEAPVDGIFTIRDGSTKDGADVVIKVVAPAAVPTVSAGQFVTVTGVVAKKGDTPAAAENVIILRSIQ